MKHLILAGTIMEFAGIAIFASSFFVDDNKKAVRRRWAGLAVGGAGYGLRWVGFMDAKKA